MRRTARSPSPLQRCCIGLVRILEDYPKPKPTTILIFGLGLGLTLGTRIMGGMAVTLYGAADGAF